MLCIICMYACTHVFGDCAGTGKQVSLWCTINEPEVCTANGYVIGMFPPGKLAALQRSGIVLGNLLKAHVAVSGVSIKCSD